MGLITMVVPNGAEVSEVLIGGRSYPVINGTIDVEIGYVAMLQGAGYITSSESQEAAGVLGVTGTAPVASSGGRTPAISIVAASGTVPGSMSAAQYTKLDGIAAGATVAPVTSYGGMFVFNESAATVALTVAGTFYPIVASVQAGSVKGAPWITFASAALTIGASGAGLYLVNCSFSGILSATDTLDLAIHKGGTIQNNIRSDQSVTNQTSYCSGAMTGLLALISGDVIDVRAACDGGSKTLQMKHMNLTLLRVA